MKQLIPVYILLLIMILPERATGGSYPEKTINKAMKLSGKIMSEYLGETIDNSNHEALPLEKGMKHYAVYDTLFRIRNESAEFRGYLVISSAKGRYERFDFMIIYGLNKKPVEIRILTYRSDHGSQVSSKVWLRKFAALDPRKDIIYGEDIDALSGATFSAKSLTGEINRLNKLILELN